MSENTQPCPVCGKLMIRRQHNMVLTSYPPIHGWYWWCGGCGHEEQGGLVREKTDEEMARERWAAAQEGE